jgi:hypothetical protein
MTTCIPCPPCEADIPLTCEPYGTVSVGNRVMVEDDAFCTKTLATPSGKAILVWDNGVKWQEVVGVSGSFTSNDGKTITVTGGIVTGIV